MTARRTRRPNSPHIRNRAGNAARMTQVEPLETRTLFSVNFLPAVQVPTGAAPYAIAKGDFNGDGIADLVTANVAGSSLSVELSTRPASPTSSPFPPGPCVNTSLPFHPILVTAGDFDGDGKADVAVISQTTSVSSTGQVIATNSASFLHGLGDGHFAAPQPLPVPASQLTQPNFLTSADFNGDGIADLAVYNSADGSVFLCDGSVRGLLPAVRYQASTTPGGQRLATGDFNGDGKTDLVTAGEGGTLNFLFNAGDGTLLPAVQVASGISRVGAVAVGDFNGDGVSDLALGTYYQSVHFFLGGVMNASGGGGGAGFQLTPAGVNTYPAQVSAITTGDFNADGKTDVAVGGATFLSYQLNTGPSPTGFFSAPTQLNPAAGPNPNGLVAGDFDGDGSVDLALSDTGKNSMDIYFNRVVPTRPVSTLTAAGKDFTAYAGVSFTKVLASFTDSLGNQGQNNYSATIDWGDGSALTNGLIASPAGNPTLLCVVGAHAYAATGNFTLHITIKPANGPAVVVTELATVLAQPGTTPPAFNTLAAATKK